MKRSSVFFFGINTLCPNNSIQQQKKNDEADSFINSQIVLVVYTGGLKIKKTLHSKCKINFIKEQKN